jgi:hypothetical protein
MKYPYQSKYTITYKNWYKKYCEGRKKWKIRNLYSLLEKKM